MEMPFGIAAEVLDYGLWGRKKIHMSIAKEGSCEGQDPGVLQGYDFTTLEDLEARFPVRSREQLKD